MFGKQERAWFVLLIVTIVLMFPRFSHWADSLRPSFMALLSEGLFDLAKYIVVALFGLVLVRLVESKEKAVWGGKD